MGVIIVTLPHSFIVQAESKSMSQSIVLAGVLTEDYDVGIAREVLKRAGYTAEFIQQPWARCLVSMREGRVDVLANVFKNTKRQEFLLYTNEAIFNFKQFLYTGKNSEIQFDGDLNSLSEYIIGTRLGFSYGEHFDKAVESKVINVEKVTNPIQNLKKIALGRIDLFVENPMNLILECGQQDIMDLLSQVKLMKPAISNQQSFITVS